MNERQGGRRLGRRAAWVLCVAVAAGGGCTDRDSSDGADRTVFGEDSGVRVRLEFPDGWRVRRDKENVALMGVAESSEGDRFAANVNVVIERLPAPMSARDYWSQAAPRLEGALGDFEAGDVRLVELAGREAARARFGHRFADVPISCLTFIIVEDRDAFVITCSADRDDYAAFEPRFERIVDTFGIER